MYHASTMTCALRVQNTWSFFCKIGRWMFCSQLEQVKPPSTYCQVVARWKCWNLMELRELILVQRLLRIEIPRVDQRARGTRSLVWSLFHPFPRTQNPVVLSNWGVFWRFKCFQRTKVWTVAPAERNAWLSSVLSTGKATPFVKGSLHREIWPVLVSLNWQVK